MSLSYPTLVPFGLLLMLGISLSAEPPDPTLVPGPPRELSLTPGQAQIFAVSVGEPPLLLQVEQRSLDVVVEAHGPGRRLLATDAGETRWGPEILVLEGAGTWRVEVRAKEVSGWPGSVSISFRPLGEETLPSAWTDLSRGGMDARLGTPEARTRALASYRAALAAWREPENRRGQAEALTRLALLEQASSDPKGASSDYDQAAALWRELHDVEREAAVQNELGLTRREGGSFEEARIAFERAVELWRSRDLRFDGAETRSNQCLLEQTVGNLSAALACYAEPLAIFREAGDRSDEDRILNNLGGIYDTLGEPDAALAEYQKALALRHARGDSLGEAQTLNNIAVIRRTLGDWQEALRLYGEEREILSRYGDPALEAALLNNVGYTYNSLGEPRRALAFLGEALRLRRQINDRRGEVVTLNNLGVARRRLGEPEAALQLHQRARDLAGVLGDLRQEAVSRLRLAEAQVAGGDFATALRELGAVSAALKDAGMRQGELQALELRGTALLQSGRNDEALPVLQDALAGRRALRDRGGEAGTLVLLAMAERASGDVVAARSHAEEAVARAEELRSGFASPDLRAAFLATQRRAYSLLIDLLMMRHAAEPQGGWDRAALNLSERARARSLLDALGLVAGQGGSAGAPGLLLERRQALRHRLSSKAEQQLRQQSGAKAEALGKEVDALVAELDSVEAEIRRADPRYDAFSKPPSVGLEEIAGLLDPGTAFLEFALGEERSYLWMIAGGELRSFVLPPEREIESLARQVYSEVSTVEAGGRAKSGAAERLSRILLGQAWSVAGSALRWAIVPDGALHLLPFSALPAPDAAGGLLLERVEIDSLPSATTLLLQRRRTRTTEPAHAARRAAIIADPVFSPLDPRVPAIASASIRATGKAKTKERMPPRPKAPRPAGSETGTAIAEPEVVLRGAGTALQAPFERLAASGREANAIAALAPPGEVSISRDFNANRDLVLSGSLRDYRVIHFATHAVADTRTPELSGLVLSQVDEAGRQREGFLGLADIYDLRLTADLVVLSGCRTAFGREVRGEGLMGLTRAFLYAGVPRVVASLWPVQDRAAADLMTRFYRALWREGRSPSAALREAQRALRRDPRYRDPFYWSGYLLQGDWR